MSNDLGGHVTSHRVYLYQGQRQLMKTPKDLFHEQHYVTKLEIEKLEKALLEITQE